MAEKTDPISLPADIRDEHKIDLRRKPRLGEMLIQSLLFICASISILTTIGIVYELGKESLLFFTKQNWESTNKPLDGAIDESTTLIKVGASGSSLVEGDIIRVENEILWVIRIDGFFLTVERGYQNTQESAHASGVTIQRSIEVSLREFFTKTSWIPQIGEFGVLPLVTSTVITSLIAMIVALPIGLFIAIYLSEYASERFRNWLKPILEILAGVPTVVYGYFALMFMTPILRSLFGQNVVEIYNMASGGIVIGILIVPLISSMSEDALSAVPRSLREAAYALGSTRLETALKVVVPAAISGISAAVILGMSRAIGETMIVAIAVGAGPNFTFNPFKGAETMTGHIVRISGGDLSYDSIDYNSIFAIGLLLFCMTLGLNILSNRIVRRFREVYE